MKSKIVKLSLLSLSIVHLSFVALNASYIDILDWLPAPEAFDFYLKATGADSSFGFFAPSIGTKVYADFFVVDENGHKTPTQLLPHASREAITRLGGIYDQFTSEEAQEKEFRQPLAASLAAAIFNQHDEAQEVYIRIKEFWHNTMDEYRAGNHPEWAEYYSAHMSRGEKQ